MMSKGRISQRVIDLLEANDFRYISSEKDHWGYVAEVEMFSPAGEDFICVIRYNGTTKSFIRAFGEYANNFDPDQHAGELVEQRGNRGVPSTIRELLDDAEAIKASLFTMAEKLAPSKKTKDVAPTPIVDTEQLTVRRAEENNEYLLAVVENRTEGIVVVSFQTEAAEEFAHPLFLTPFDRTFGIFAGNAGAAMLEAFEAEAYDVDSFTLDKLDDALTLLRRASIPSWRKE